MFGLILKHHFLFTTYNGKNRGICPVINSGVIWQKSGSIDFN